MGVLVFQMIKDEVKQGGYIIIHRLVCPVCELQRIHIGREVGFNVVLNKPLIAFHGHGSEGNRVIVIQTVGILIFGYWHYVALLKQVGTIA